MIALFEEFLDWRDPEPGPDGLTDYSLAAVDRRAKNRSRFIAEAVKKALG